MSAPITPRSQRGAALVISLIMLTVITVMVTSAFTLSATNLQSVGNRQLRGEAVAAANKAIEQIVSSPFANAPKAESIDVDIDNDGKTDYTVDFAAPTCVSATELAGSSLPPSSVSLGPSFAIATSSYYQTVWDLDGTVVDAASGTSVRVRQGVRVLLTRAQFDVVCK
jgi:Tfp pilus assembly protein PilX